MHRVWRAQWWRAGTGRVHVPAPPETEALHGPHVVVARLQLRIPRRGGGRLRGTRAAGPALPGYAGGVGDGGPLPDVPRPGVAGDRLRGRALAGERLGRGGLAVHRRDRRILGEPVPA